MLIISMCVTKVFIELTWPSSPNTLNRENLSGCLDIPIPKYIEQLANIQMSSMLPYISFFIYTMRFFVSSFVVLLLRF